MGTGLIVNSMGVKKFLESFTIATPND